MKKNLIPIILVIIIAILVIGWLGWKWYKSPRGQNEQVGLSISTYQKEYNTNENPKIKIENKATEPICFSSCYPYYLEKKDGLIKSYTYGSCPHEDVVENCVNPDQVKAFELILDHMGAEKGLHRIAIPACVGCALNQNFRQDKFFYSNEFVIK